jgi:hypothetical protein
MLNATLKGPPYMDVVVNRATVLQDMLAIYGDETLALHEVRVTFVFELGKDFGGLTKELYTLVWRNILDEYFKGDSAMVPSLPLYKQNMINNFVKLGRILSHSVALLKHLPPRISRCTMLSLANASNKITDDVLYGDFR